MSSAPAPLTTWACPLCTFLNPLDSLGCQVCTYSCADETPRGGSPSKRDHRPERQAASGAAARRYHQSHHNQNYNHHQNDHKSQRPPSRPDSTGGGGVKAATPIESKPPGLNSLTSSSSNGGLRKRSSTECNSSPEDQIAAWDLLLKRQKMSTAASSSSTSAAKTQNAQPMIPKIEALLRRNPKIEFRLCHPSFTPAHQTFDRKWGCGYRNLQNVISCLWDAPEAAPCLTQVLTPREVPGIGELQNALEQAWRRGYDPAGAAQLDHAVKGTQKWIGATEVAVILRSLRFQAELTDFRRPSTDEGTHPLLFETVVNYFNNPPPLGIPHPPIFLQYQGHSLTIIGYEKEDDRQNLLIFDPATTPERLKAALDKGDLRLFRHSLKALKKPQFQLVQIEGLYAAGQEESSKMLSSRSLP